MSATMQPVPPTWKSLLLFALALAAAADTDLSGDHRAALRRWLSDPHVRHAAFDGWANATHPLAAALAAAEPSEHTSDSYARCLADVQFLIDGLGSFQVPDAYKMLDASVQVPEGILNMAWTHIGNWDECVGVRGVKTQTGSFDGKLCMVKFFPTLDSSRDVQTYEDGLFVPTDAEGPMGQVDQLISMISISLGQCVPSSCATADVQSLFRRVAAKMPSIYGVNMNASVADGDCTMRERPSLDAADWAAVGVLGALGVLVALSTAYDVLTPAARRKALPAAFSVVSNGRKLLAAPRGGGDQTLSCLHGLRFLSMCWVLVAHRYMRSATTPAINMSFRMNFFKAWYHIGITNGTLSVDTFFVLSGLLVGYLFFKQAPSKRRLNIPMYYIHRYIRLTPAFAMMVLLSATLIGRVGWGPLWPSMIESREVCRKNWWNALLYIGNYIDSVNLCVPQSWYLMVDMQLHWVSPLLLIPMTHRPRAAFIVIAVLCFAGIVGNFVFSYVADIPGIINVISDVERRQYAISYFYVPIYSRFVPYLEGLVVGYILGNRQATGEKSKRVGRLVAAAAWLTVAALLLVPLSTGYDFAQMPLPSKLPTAFFNALHRATWGLGVAGLVYLCASGNGGPVNALLSWWAFQVLGRFNYCVYLVHMALQNILAGSLKTVTYVSDRSVLTEFAGDLLLSLMVAGVLSVLCESPFLVLEKEILGRSKEPRNESNRDPAPEGHRTEQPTANISEESNLRKR